MNLPETSVKIKQEKGITYLFDPFRKKYMQYTPEEWVRQRLLGALVVNKGYPAGLISVEKQLKVNKLQKRYDAVVYNKAGLPLLLIECKAPQIGISQETFYQIARYNSVLRVPFLLVSNGLNHFTCRVDFETGACQFLETIPTFKQLTENDTR